MVASASELLDAQFAGRANLRAIYDAVISTVRRFGDVEIQVRKTYVSLLTARRTFARIQVARGDRLAVGLRLPGRSPVGRLKPSSIHESMRVQLGLARPRDLRDDTVKWLETAFKANGSLRFSLVGGSRDAAAGGRTGSGTLEFTFERAGTSS